MCDLREMEREEETRASSWSVAHCLFVVSREDEEELKELQKEEGLQQQEANKTTTSWTSCLQTGVGRFSLGAPVLRPALISKNGWYHHR
jgi:hypothetical protein